MTSRRLFVLTFLLLGAAACGSKSPTSPTDTAAYSQTDLVVGSGRQAATGNLLTVNYTGWLYSASAPENKGTQFDSSASRGPFQFRLGGNVITGWNQGVAGMAVGGKRRLVIPAALGYGSAGSPPAIPGNATLVFDIELLNVTD